MWQKIVKNLWSQYAAFGLVVMLPLLMPGYILTLDLVFAPHISWPTNLSNTYLFEAILHVLNLIIPSQIIEKLLLLAALVLSGVGAHKLFFSLVSNLGGRYLIWGAYFAGLFYMINPFIYDRFMAGQYLVLLGYALTPFFVLQLLKLLKNPNLQNAIWLAFWSALVVGVSLHHAGMLLIIGVPIALGTLWRYRKQAKHIKDTINFGVVAVTAFFLINAYWLVPTALGKTDISQATSSFNAVDSQAFATSDTGGLGAVGSVLRLQGFWAESRDMFTQPQQVVPAWGLIVILLWILVGFGVVWFWRTNRPRLVALGSVALAAVVLAATPLISWLAPLVPFASGYREPQKFVSMLALVYAVLAGVGVSVVLQKFAAKHSRLTLTIVACLIMLLPVVCTPTMVWGFNGQLTPKSYPDDWYAANKYLNNEKNVKKVLFLPWHQYIDFSFSGRIIANPANKFFDKPTVVGDNPEFKNIKPTVPNANNRLIEQNVLAMGSLSTTLGNQLDQLGFSHVILAKEYDYQSYNYLDKQSDLLVVQDTPTLKVYEVVKGEDTDDAK